MRARCIGVRLAGSRSARALGRRLASARTFRAGWSRSRCKSMGRLRVPRRLSDQGLILLRRHPGQPANESNEVPDGLVVMARSPGGHSGQLHAVLDDPESATRIHSMVQAGWLRIAAPLQLIFRHPRCTVATRTHLRIVPRAALSQHFFRQRRCDDVFRSDFDRPVAHLLDQLRCNRPIRFVNRRTKRLKTQRPRR